MKTISRASFLALVGVLFAATVSPALAAAADIANPTSRKTVVATAQKLAAETPAAPLPTAPVNPFNPSAFGEPDPEELAAIAAAKAAEAASVVKTKPMTDVDLLQQLAEKINPSGIVTMAGEPLLIFGQKRLRVGDSLTVSHDGKDYKVELAGIQRSTFSLRFNRAELTRRINP